MAESKTTYDEVPITVFPFPGRIRIAWRPWHTCSGWRRRPRTSRVLELAAPAAETSPMATLYPESSFLGIDLSARQIEDGRVRSLNENSNLPCQHHGRERLYGKFDYIICHGVYTWVPVEVQTKSSASAATASPTASPMSANTLPGWHMRHDPRQRCHHAMRSEPPMPSASPRPARLHRSPSAPMPTTLTPCCSRSKPNSSRTRRTGTLSRHLGRSTPLYFYSSSSRPKNTD